MNALQDELKKRILVADGAMGTILHEKGLDSSQIPEEWNIERPDIIKDIHKSYIDAGSDIITTNTFGASRFKLELCGLANQVKNFNKKAAELALAVSAGSVYVLADIGPSGKFIKPYGDVEFGDLYSNFKEQVFALKDTGIHGFIIETMTDIHELDACILAVKDSTNLPLMASMTFNELDDGSFKTMMGVGIKQAIDKITSRDCSIIGTNCGNGTSQILEIVKEMRNLLKEHKGDSFIIAQPNAGTPKIEGGKTYFGESPQDFKDIIPRYIEEGVNIIGGCCGTTPSHIQAISKIVKG